MIVVEKNLKKKKKTHKLILHEAKKLFEKDGVSAVTIENIAKSANISRSTFFSHFQNMGELLNEIVVEELLDLMNAAENTGEVAPKERLAIVMEKLLDDTFKYPYLTVELFTNAIIRIKGHNKTKELIDNLTKGFSIKDNLPFGQEYIKAVILGVYFGMIFSKITNEKADTEGLYTKDAILKVYDYFIK